MVFPARRCAGLPSSGFPKEYASTVDLSGITFTDAGIDPRPKGVEGTTWTVRDTAVALYSSPAGPATNKAALDDLATRAAQDLFDFRSVRFDKVHAGINSIPPNALIDVATFCYTSTEQYTRIQSPPHGGEPREFQHQDPAISACHADDRSPGVLMDIPGAPINSSMTGVVSLEDGRLLLTYDATASVPCSCTPSTPPCGSICVAADDVCTNAPIADIPVTITIKKSGTAIGTCTATGREVASLNVTSAGTGYSSVTPPAVTIAPPASGVTATATAIVVFGNVAGFRITNGGGGYTSNPAVTIAPPASGVTATATATRGARCCVNVNSSGTSGQYTADLSAAGYTPRTNVSVGAVSCTGTSITPVAINLNPTTIRATVTASTNCITTGTFSTAIPGATLTVSGQPPATTDPSGHASVTIPAGTATAFTVAKSRWATYSGTFPSSACPEGAGAAMIPDSSHSSVRECLEPIASTLTLTDSIFGAVTLTNAGGACDLTWTGSMTVTSIADTCPAASCTITYTLHFNGSLGATALNIKWTADPGSPSCPGAGPGIGDNQDNAVSIACPPSVLITGSLSAAAARPRKVWGFQAVSWSIVE